MIMENKSVWLITAKTNLHVGNENASNYGLIDKSIQRDALTGLPCINSSSLKGALNEYFTMESKEKIDLLKVFGSDKTPDQKVKKDTQKGSYAFFDAQILFLPVQGEQGKDELFHLATSTSVLQRFIDRMTLFGMLYEDDHNRLIEKLQTKIGKHRIAPPYSDSQFKELCDDDNLPIIARNKLENGESANLWYEQILPQETVFYTIFRSDKPLIEGILDNKIVQIGANATIGYGYCKFQKLNFSKP